MLYLLAAILVRSFFLKLDDEQRRAAALKKMGVIDLTAVRMEKKSTMEKGARSATGRKRKAGRHDG